MSGMAGNHLRKLHIFPRSRCRNGVSHHPNNESDNPEPQAQAQGRCQCAVENGDATRSPTKKDGVGQSSVERNFKAGEMGLGLEA